MNLQELRAYLDRLVDSLDRSDRELLSVRLESLVSVFPFNDYEYMLTFLVDRGIIRFNEYEKLRQDYISTNCYLTLFSLSPRVFGQMWGEKHLMDLDPRFQKPARSLDPDYDGQYDLWIEGMRVEVKAARAIHTRKRGDLVSKALHHGSADPFWMNFQQLKLDLCDAFVFIGVWADRIVYWAMSNEEVKTNPYLSHQHRGGIEYQLRVTRTNLPEFDVYRVEATCLADTVIAKAR